MIEDVHERRRALDSAGSTVYQRVRGMARDEQPMTDEELEDSKDEIHDLFAEVREDLAEDLGGEPEDYRADRTAADGSGE